VHDTKRAVADGILGSEVRRIVRELPAVRDETAASDPVSPTQTSRTTVLVDAVAELLACFPVYRSYLPEGRAHLDEAFDRARTHRPDLAATLEGLRPVLSDPEAPPALRFQQTSGMVMAKGVEDCAFYRWSRLTSLNEVGADPGVFSITPGQFHEQMAVRQALWPDAMTTLSTHDTKRGEDVRARITALAEMPERWMHALARLLELAPLPDPGFGSLLWQAALGAWPISRERLHAYAEKAMREAGDRTTWTAPDPAYEEAVHAAVDAAYDDPRVTAVIEALLSDLVRPGWSNALAAKLVALTMPGVPDVYQGSELVEQSLVDPDNRRPVDFDLPAALLTAADSQRPERVKLLVTRTALRLRRDRPELFTTYTQVAAAGTAADHVLSFDRGGAITVATRLPVGLADDWGDTRLDLPPGTWHDLLTGRTTDGGLFDLLADHPVALLVREDS
jgi:(1->4)-alpha-D-glucan 1-alpha-D-glucosylmutase